MKIPNTVCSGCNQMLDLIYKMREEFGIVNEAKCYHCNKEYPFRPCNLCKRNTIHIGNNFRTCTDCIIDKGFNLETEFNIALLYLVSIMNVKSSQEGFEVLKDIRGYLESLERRGYDKKHYTDDLNKHIQDSNQRVVVEQSEDRPETD